MTQAQQTPTKSAYIRARVTPDLKADSEAVLHELGLSLTEAITMFLAQVKAQKGIPFDVRIPNTETQTALDNAHARENLVSHGTLDELFSDLNANA